MSESLRDRVARIIHDVALAGLRMPPEFFEEQPLATTDALIAAGLVAEGGEPPITAFEVMATGHGLPIMLYHGAHDHPLRVRSWTHDGDRFLVEYVEAPREDL